MRPDDHYVVISCDTHAGGSHAQYREYLDDRYKPAFDEWRAKYKNPFKDLKDTDERVRNWDAERRDRDQNGDGVVAEVIFPNTVPPFFPSFVLFAQPPKPEDYAHRRAGIQAHNRWMADFVAEAPERRAGIGQIFTNDIDDAIEDLHWIKEHDLRGGVLIPNIAPDVTWLKPLYDPEFDRLWATIQDLDMPINVHGGTGVPDYGKYPVSQLLYINEVSFYAQRPLVQMILSGVFERFPRLKFVITETGGAWIPPLLDRLDQVMARIRDTGATGEIRYPKEVVLPKLASEYFAQNCWVGVSQPGPADAAARHAIGLDRFMWGSDYPHDEGTHPYTREHLRARFSAVDPAEVRMMLSENAAERYDFDLAALRPLAQEIGPTVAEVQTPIDGVPEKSLERISGDMDTRAIK